MKKEYPLNVVLTVTTGRLLTEGKKPNDNGIGDLYEIMNHMLDDNLTTLALPYGGEKCRPVLLGLFPELKVYNSEKVLVMLDKAVEKGGMDGIKIWIKSVQKSFPAINDSYEIEGGCAKN